MRVLLQRVSEAAVRIDGTIVGEIGPGLLALVCAVDGDGQADVERLAGKTTKLRIFEDEAGKMNRSVADIGVVFLWSRNSPLPQIPAKATVPVSLEPRHQNMQAPWLNSSAPTSGRWAAGRDRQVRGGYENFPD